MSRRAYAGLRLKVAKIENKPTKFGRRPRQTGCCKGRPGVVKAHTRLKSRVPMDPARLREALDRSRHMSGRSGRDAAGRAACSCPRSTGLPALPRINAALGGCLDVSFD